ncbi:GspE/PulE family protein [Paraherbaspirillum soli]|uniref:GspE/PulE family protein n=1 Tax=Paraherbaspirillum soli TaxID=631222 RepID=A0ABW0M6F7_9BURK
MKNEPISLKRVLDAEFIVEMQRQSSSALNAIELIAESFGADADGYLQAAAAYFGMAPVTIDGMRLMKPEFDLISFVDANKRLCIAFTDQNNELKLVTADPLDVRTRSWIYARLRNRSAQSLSWGIATIGDLRSYLVSMEKTVRAMDSIGISDTVNASDSAALSISIEDISSTGSQIVRLVNSTIYDALRAGASDIHLETLSHGMNIKYRLDGVLTTIKHIDGSDTSEQVLSRIKVISELDIAERRIPQDGRFKVLAETREIDLRVSIMPNLFGEDAVLRILDRYHLSGERQTLSLETLGFADSAMAFVRRLSLLPYGLLLVTGPTGSGKTTTVYAAISEINTGLDKIVTIEDPVEYQLAGVLQIPVNEKKGLTFARGLRSILRHDPDKIMVGEIRDPETAQIAVQAALTGHQVFTTVHANNVFDVIGRFANMGVDSYSFVSALNGILAQRLVRINCPQCAIDDQPSAELIHRSGLGTAALSRFNFKRSLGCAHCRGTGFKGRRAIAETLSLDDTLRDLMAERAALSKIKHAARLAGLRTLRESAVDLVAAGMTTLEEINRVTPVE